MSYIDKVLGIAGMGTTIANVSVLKRFVEGIQTVIALTAIASTLAGMIMMVAFYGIYVGLVQNGLDPAAAVIAVGGLAIIATAILGALAVNRWRQLQELPKLLQGGPILGPLGKVADAFIDGFTGERNHREH